MKRHKWDDEGVCERCGMWRSRRVSHGRPVFGNRKRITIRYIRKGEIIGYGGFVPPCRGTKDAANY